MAGWLLLAAVLGLLREGRGYSNGLVAASCETLLPAHGSTTPSSQAPPYTLSASASTYRPGASITGTTLVLNISLVQHWYSMYHWYNTGTQYITGTTLIQYISGTSLASCYITGTSVHHWYLSTSLVHHWYLSTSLVPQYITSTPLVPQYITGTPLVPQYTTGTSVHHWYLSTSLVPQYITHNQCGTSDTWSLLITPCDPPVTLETASNSSTPFQGFILQARSCAGPGN